MPINFTKQALEELKAPTTSRAMDVYDSKQRGLICRVTEAGGKTFYVRRKIGGRSERLMIGPFPVVTVEQARKQALALLSQVAQGINPRDVVSEAPEEMTVGEMFQNYVDGHALIHCRRGADMPKVFRRYLSDWKNKPLSSIKRSDAQTRFNQVVRRNGPAAANHVLIAMRAAVNWNLRNGYISGENPWCFIKPMKLQSRERFLRPEEIGRFYESLQQMPNETMRDYILVSLYTGARKSNVLAMKWTDIDWDLAVWEVERTKNGQRQFVPLTAAALDVLRVRFAQTESVWVFPGKDKSKHLVEPKRAWNNMIKSAGLQNLRLHDLRRTLGSYMAMTNQSMKIIGAALGHQSTAATEIYARLAHEPVRTAMETAQSEMFRRLGATEKLEPSVNTIGKATGQEYNHIDPH